MSNDLRPAAILWDAAVITPFKPAVAASIASDTGDPNSDVLFTWDTPGTVGNGVEILINDGLPGPPRGLSIVDVGPVVFIHLANDGANVTTTPNALIAAWPGASVIGAHIIPTAVGTGAVAIPDADLFFDVVPANPGHFTNFALLAGGTNDDYPTSAVASLGPATDVALFVVASGTCALKVQAAASHSPSAGRNGIPTDDDDWYDYVRGFVWGHDAGGAVEASPLTASLSGGAPAVCLECSPFAPSFLRLKRVDDAFGFSQDQTITAYTVALG